MRKAAAGLAVVAVLAGAAALALRHRGSPTPRPERLPAAAAAPTSRFRGVELVESDADGTRWRLSAESGVAWERQASGVLTGVSATFERRGNAIRVTAGAAEVRSAQVVRLSGGVRIQWGDYEARLDEATYRRGEGRVVSRSPVVLAGPGLEVKGEGVEVDVEGRRARVLSKVRAVVKGRAP